MASVDGQPHNLAEVVAERLRAGKRVRRNLQPVGRVQVDRPLPFLCIYRKPTDRQDLGTEQLVVGEGSYLTASGDETSASELGELVLGVTSALSERFGAVLLIEVWSGSALSGSFLGGALVAPPRFRVRVPVTDTGRTTVAALIRGLRRLRIASYQPRVEVTHGSKPVPPGMSPLMTAAAADRLGIVMLGLEVPPVYQDPVTGGLFPSVLRAMQRGLSRALRQASFRFAHLQTSHRPDHYHRLGPRTVLKAALEADRELAEISDAFSLLLAVTPVNAAEAWEQFEASGFAAAPTLRYRLLNWDPEVLKRRLYTISLERVEDPALTELLREKREELDRQIMLLHDRGTPQFLHGSMQLYGGIEPDLLRSAERLLSAVESGSPSRDSDRGDGEIIDAPTFAAQARHEIAAYQRQWSDAAAKVELRDDVVGLLVSRDRLLVDQNLTVPLRRVEPLLHHEVGTHLLTYLNASVQPLSVLRTGLPAYDELQEGTAVLAEYLTGGLTPARMRLLAARVVAVDRLIRGASFPEVFTQLRDLHGFTAKTAFTVTLRVFRGGGFTKDAVYLRGLARLLKYLAAGGELEPLFLGKVSLAALPILQELRWREVLSSPPLRPRYLDLPHATERLDRVRRGLTVAELIS